ncbi:MAG: ABC transporter substrate-binding protein [Immundisolibacteraceae bacterium]|nr:ABC transporter substrate-binding protein [Immundisolibacteraceae bacterium]
MAESRSIWFATAHLQFTNNIILTNSEPFAQEGFSVHPMNPGIGDKVVRSLVDGRADYCNVLGMPIIRAVEGLPLKFIASFQNTGWELWTRPNIERLEDLEGKTIGRTSPFPRERLDSALLEQGVDPASVAEGPFVQLDAAGIQEVVDGVVDGALLMAPISSMAREAGLVSPYDLNLSGDSVAYGIMTTDWMLAENRDEVKRFLRALLRSTADLKQNRELARSLVEQQFVPDRYIEQALDATLSYLNESGELAIESQQRWIDISRRLLGLETPVALDQVFDFSILQELAAEAAE